MVEKDARNFRNEEVGEEEVEQQGEVGIQEQHLQAPPDDGKIQRLCDECAAEKSEEKDREIIQTKAEIPGISGENFNKNLFKPVPLNKQSHTGQNSLLPSGGLPNFLNKNVSGLLLTKKVPTPLPQGEVSAPATPDIKLETEVTNPESEEEAARPTDETKPAPSLTTPEVEVTPALLNEKSPATADSELAQATGSFKLRMQRLLLANGNKNYDNIISLIGKASKEERRSVVGNRNMRLLIANSLKPELATVVMGYLLNGEQEWQNPPNNDFFQHFVRDKKDSPMAYDATMNCWEMILYAAFLLGQVSGDQIRTFCNNSFNEGHGIFMEVWGRLGWKTGLPYYRGRAPNGEPKQAVPRPGQLLFFVSKKGKKPGHVAISFGGEDALSLWDQPNQYKQIQRIKVSDLKGFVQIGEPLSVTQLIQ